MKTDANDTAPRKRQLLFSLDVETKKGTTYKTRWLVYRTLPRPCIKGHCSSGLGWENTDGLKHSGGNPPNVKEEYLAYLLADGAEIDEYTKEYNRTVFAGYTPSRAYGEKEAPKPNPGTIVYRGSDLGEVSVDVAWGHVKAGDGWTRGLAVDSIKVRGFNNAAGVERDFIRDRIGGPLVAFINANRAELLEMARADLAERLADEVAEARAAINAAEAAIPALLSVPNLKTEKD